MIYHSTNRGRTFGHRISGGRHRVTRRFGIMVAVMLMPAGIVAVAAGFLTRVIAL